jgi:hypothetical protein
VQPQRCRWQPGSGVYSPNAPDGARAVGSGLHTRRFTRLTNAFSKKVENHAHSVALFAMYYNFVRIHKTLRTTPAMAAGVTDRLWEMSDVVHALEAWEAAN